MNVICVKPWRSMRSSLCRVSAMANLNDERKKRFGIFAEPFFLLPTIRLSQA
jgi:hypothetical protein